MPTAPAPPDLLSPRREASGDEVLYRFANGLCIRTEVFHKRDPLRILPLGSPQFALMNHLVAFPDRASGKRVLEPFAGSGALGFMALAVGARHVEFLDINPRAADFHRRNAEANGFAPSAFGSITGDVETFTPERPYELILANPPFVPTPDGLAGTLTSNGGPEGNRLVEILLRRLDALLAPDGRALIYLFQLVAGGRPLAADLLAALLPERAVNLTPSQERWVPFEAFRAAYAKLFPAAAPAIQRWALALRERHGRDLHLCHYVADVLPRGAGTPGCTIRDDFRKKFGAAFLVPSEKPEELALGRAFENLIPGP
jgi:hypothetical protein